MSLLKGPKRLINKGLRAFGYELVKYVKEKEKVWHVDDAIAHNSMEKIEEFYGREDFLDSYIGESRTEFYHIIVNFIRAQQIDMKDKTVVDVGCGTGHLLAYVREKLGAKSGTGLEYSLEALKIGNKLFPELEFHQYDIYTKWNKQYDYVLCTEVLEHLLYPDTALKNIMDMIKEDGFALITVPNGRTDTFGGHINFWSPESWNVFITTNTKGSDAETGMLHNNQVNYALIRKRA